MSQSVHCAWLPGVALGALAAALASLAAPARSAELSDDASGSSAAQKRVLIVTGEDHKAHNWQSTTPVLKAQLEKDSRLAIEVSEDPASLRSPSPGDYDAVVMHFKNYDPEKPGRQGYDNLAKFVKEGHGLVLVHFACGAFQEFRTDFVKLAGRVWNPELRAHDPYGKFRVEIVAPDHPMVDGKRYPTAFVLPYGEGRVFHCVLGHNAEALGVAEVGELFRRGTAWAADLEPTPPGTGRANP